MPAGSADRTRSVSGLPTRESSPPQQQDERGVGNDVPRDDADRHGRQRRAQQRESAGHPILQDWAYPLPGDSIITTIQRVIIDVPARKVVRLQMPPDQHRGTVIDNLNMDDLKWRPDGSRTGLRLVVARSQACLAPLGERDHRCGAHRLRRIFADAIRGGAGRHAALDGALAQQRSALVVGARQLGALLPL